MVKHPSQNFSMCLPWKHMQGPGISVSFSSGHCQRQSYEMESVQLLCHLLVITVEKILLIVLWRTVLRSIWNAAWKIAWQSFCRKTHWIGMQTIHIVWIQNCTRNILLYEYTECITASNLLSCHSRHHCAKLFILQNQGRVWVFFLIYFSMIHSAVK